MQSYAQGLSLYTENGHAGACGVFSQDSDVVVGLPLEVRFLQLLVTQRRLLTPFVSVLQRHELGISLLRPIHHLHEYSKQQVCAREGRGRFRNTGPAHLVRGRLASGRWRRQ